SCCRRARFAQIVINNQDALGGPAQRLGACHQTILQSGRLRVREYLLGSRLPHVDHGQALALPGTQLLCRQAQGKGLAPSIPSIPSITGGRGGRHEAPPLRMGVGGRCLSSVGARRVGRADAAAALDWPVAGTPTDCMPARSWAGGSAGGIGGGGGRGEDGHGTPPSCGPQVWAARSLATTWRRLSSPLCPIMAGGGMDGKSASWGVRLGRLDHPT